MNRTVFFILILSAFSFHATAQFETSPGESTSKSSPKSTKSNPVKQQSSIKDKIVLGGGLDLSFGTVTYIGVTPMVGYYATDKLIVGGIFTYRYFENTTTKYSTSTYGVSPFLRYSIFKGLFAHVEYEMMYGEWSYGEADWLKSLFVGGGYNVQIGDRGFAGVYLLWNLTEDPDLIYQPYSNPTMRMSFGVGL